MRVGKSAPVCEKPWAIPSIPSHEIMMTLLASAVPSGWPLQKIFWTREACWLRLRLHRKLKQQLIISLKFTESTVSAKRLSAPDCFYCSQVDTSTLQFINCNRADQTTERETLGDRSLQVDELWWLYLLVWKQVLMIEIIIQQHIDIWIGHKKVNNYEYRY